jgi:hypothetical protein
MVATVAIPMTDITEKVIVSANRIVLFLVTSTELVNSERKSEYISVVDQRTQNNSSSIILESPSATSSRYSMKTRRLATGALWRALSASPFITSNIELNAKMARALLI